MSNLFAKLTNLFDQDFMSFENGMPIFNWLNKHREDINSIEKSYLDDFKQLKQQLEDKNELIENLTKRINKYENMFRGRAIKRTGDIQKDLELYIKQLAIEELKKVKILLQNAANYEGYTFVGIYDAVNNQIRELKG